MDYSIVSDILGNKQTGKNTEYFFRKNIFTKDGSCISYEVYGSGPCMVFVHGGSGNSLFWWQQLAYFSVNYKVIAVDLRCYGRSVSNKESISYKNFSNDILQLLETEGIEECFLVGHSMGGGAALRLALKGNLNVLGLVLSSSTGGIWTKAIEEAIEKSPKQYRNHQYSITSLSDSFRQEKPSMAFLYDSLSRLNEIDTFGSSISIHSKANCLVPADLTNFKVPTLFVAGGKDKLMPVEFYRNICSHIPGSIFLVIPNSGHSCYFESPGEFNAAVDEFFNNC